ncbi:MAG TPA: hypothetical protein VHW03_03450 [Chthoniobacterales bacterium]|nr:hypothetical protein [Chthoniobacterales bacterium]
MAALALSVAPNASAKTKKMDADASASASPGMSERGIPYHGKIDSVDAAAKTFTITGKSGTRTFMMTDDTKIMKDGATGTMTDVMAGEMVRGQYMKKADGMMVTKSVMLGAKSMSHHHHKKAMESEASPSASPSATP